MKSTLRSWVWLVVVLGTVGIVWAAQPPADKEKSSPAGAAAATAKGTAKVEKGALNVDVTLKGVFESGDMKEISISPKVPEVVRASLMVLKAVEHGTPVKKGDTLVELDTEKVDQAIRDMEVEHNLAELAVHLAKEDLPLVEKSTPEDLAAADRAKRVADEDLEKFLKVGRPMQEENAKHMVENSEFYLQSAEEELKQLQKMYRDKDLTEETEEFILKRQKHQVKMARVQLRHARIQSEETLKLTLPRQEATLREAAFKAGVALDRAKDALPATLNQKRLTLQKMMSDFARSTEKLENLKKDREALAVKAPADGIVYYGKCVHGQWATAALVAPRLVRGGQLQPEEVFMTVVSPRPLSVEATVEEKDLHLLKPDQKAKVTPAGYPDVKLTGRLTKVSHVPQTPGSFEARLSVEPGESAEAVTPGMACTVKVAAYHKDDALTVPASAVFTDDGDEDTRYVYLKKGAKPEKKTVKVGHSSGGKTEIVEGLQEGDEILTSKP